MNLIHASIRSKPLFSDLNQIQVLTEILESRCFWLHCDTMLEVILIALIIIERTRLQIPTNGKCCISILHSLLTQFACILLWHMNSNISFRLIKKSFCETSAMMCG